MSITCASQFAEGLMRLWRQRHGHGQQAAQSQIASIVNNISAATRIEDATCSIRSPICWAVEAADSDTIHCEFLLQCEQPYQQAPVVIAASEALQENTPEDASTAAAAATTAAEATAQIAAAIQIQRLYWQWHCRWRKPSWALQMGKAPLAWLPEDASFTTNELTEPMSKRYTLEELTDPLIWQHLEVNPAECEMLLPDGRFRELFGTDKDNFQALPKWRRERLRKTIGIFDNLGQQAKHTKDALFTINELTEPKTKGCTLEEITDPLIWRNLEVNPAEREMLLPDKRFQELFGTDKDNFQALPKWRRDRLRKTIGIFDNLGQCAERSLNTN